MACSGSQSWRVRREDSFPDGPNQEAALPPTQAQVGRHSERGEDAGLVGPSWTPSRTFGSVSVNRLVVSQLFAIPPGSSVQGLLQASILEWVAIPFSRGAS